MSQLRPVTVITGASAGIGVALARVFARHGHELALVARREERLHALADEIAASGARRPIVIVADLLKPGAARQIGDALAAQGAEPQYVVNNAGFGLVGLASFARSRRTAPDDRPQCARADRIVARLCRQPRPQQRRPAQCRLDGRISARAREWRSTTPPRPTCCHSPRRCTASSSRVEYGSPCCARARCRQNLPRAPVSSGATLAPSVLTQSADDVAEAGYRGLMGGHRTIVPGCA